MWSDKYNYYNIQSDENYSQKLSKQTVVEKLLNTNNFKQKNHQLFTNTESFPWIDIIVVETDDGCFTETEEENQFVSLIAIVCSKGENIDQNKYIDSLKKLAEELNWKLYLEQDDNGNQNIKIK
ncbi:MAG: hypothetical protein IPM42_05775 [Saprospiraceae bacterium]|nr:hypothetical protein [Saprospiraceae bacterium]